MGFVFLPFIDYKYFRNNNGVRQFLIQFEDTYAVDYRFPGPPHHQNKAKVPPSPAELPPNQPQKTWYVPEVYKMEDGRENV